MSKAFIDYNKLYRIVEILKKEYNSPNYNNKEKMIDEIIYIILSKRTNHKMNNLTYDNLKDNFNDWYDLLNANISDVYSIVKIGGLGKEKSKNILKTINKIYLDYGTFEIDKFFRNKPKEEVIEYLIELPGIGMKSALCIMLYSLKLSVQPADIHIIRIFNRLGFINVKKNSHQKAQKVINNICSNLDYNINYSIHVNFKAHGETKCKSNNPLCNKCKVNKLCNFYNEL